MSSVIIPCSRIASEHDVTSILPRTSSTACPFFGRTVQHIEHAAKSIQHTALCITALAKNVFLTVVDSIIKLSTSISALYYKNIHVKIFSYFDTLPKELQKGIQNPGVLCYAIATLEMLRSSIVFREELVKIAATPISSPCNNDKCTFPERGTIDNEDLSAQQNTHTLCTAHYDQIKAKKLAKEILTLFNILEGTDSTTSQSVSEHQITTFVNLLIKEYGFQTVDKTDSQEDAEEFLTKLFDKLNLQPYSFKSDVEVQNPSSQSIQNLKILPKLINDTPNILLQPTFGEMPEGSTLQDLLTANIDTESIDIESDLQKFIQNIQIRQTRIDLYNKFHSIFDTYFRQRSIKKSNPQIELKKQISVKIKRSLVLDSVPKMLPIQLRRFTKLANSTISLKNEKAITIPNTITIPVQKPGTQERQKAHYIVRNIVTHVGSLDSGHYTSFRYIDEKSDSSLSPYWILYNDDRVSKLTPEALEKKYGENIRKGAYLTVYELVSVTQESREETAQREANKIQDNISESSSTPLVSRKRNRAFRRRNSEPSISLASNTSKVS